MQLPQEVDYERQIEEASRRAKCKKVLYLFDEAGNRQLIGIFSKPKTHQVKKYLRDQNMINRLVEFEIRTTEPDSDFVE